jgi:hypothetical protein
VFGIYWTSRNLNPCQWRGKLLAIGERSLTRNPFLSHSSAPFILPFFQEPWVFDLGRRAFAAKDVCDFPRGVGLAIDVRLVRIRRGVAGDDEDGQREGLNFPP